jgi:hypothetical protein
VGTDPSAATKPNLGTDHREWANLDVFTELGGGIDDGGGMDQA